jgi:hypothetical protein
VAQVAPVDRRLDLIAVAGGTVTVARKEVWVRMAPLDRPALMETF